MAHDVSLVEVDPAQLTGAEWRQILWGILLRGSPYTLPPLLVVIVTLAVFGVVIGIIAFEVGISPEVIQQYDFVFEIVGDLLTAVIGIYVFARNLRLLPKLQLGPYRFALVRSDHPPSESRPAVGGDSIAPR
jgi:hypothetical protein